MKYTTRNVGEGWLRVLFSMLDYTTEYGYNWTDMMQGLKEPGSIARTLANRNYRKTNKAVPADLSRLNPELQSANNALRRQLRQVPSNATKFIALNRRNSIDELAKKEFEQLDGMTVCTTWIQNNLSSLTRHRIFKNPEAQNALNFLNKNIKNDLFNPSLKTEDGRNFVKALGEGDYKSASEISNRSDSISLARDLSNYSAMVKKTIAQMDKLDANGAITVQIALDNIRYGLERLAVHADYTSAALVKRAEVRNEIDAILSKTAAVGSKKKAFTEGELEIYPGVKIARSLGGIAGDMLRNATSSRSSSTGLLADERRLTAFGLFSAGYERGIVRSTDSRWAQAHSDYINNVIMKDAVMSRMVNNIASGMSAKNASIEAKKWLDSSSTEALAWKNKVKQNTIQRGEHIGVSRYTTSDMIDEMNVQLEQYLPHDLRSLYKYAVDGFTPENSVKIPFNMRHDVMAAKEVHDKSLANLYKNGVSKVFELVGTLPEDHLVRHPFFNMVHDNEAKNITYRIVTQMKKNGYSDKQIADYVASRADAIKNSSVNMAYKELMTRLYSVERYTDPGKLLRFLTPFFMAHQNSSRFWLGTSLRNPEVAYNLAKMYNAVYRGGFVYDENGNLVSSGHPWSKDANKQSVLGLIPGVSFNPTAQDVIFQGQIPILPSLGAPASGPLTAEALKIAAKHDGIDKFLRKTTGMSLDDFSSRYIMPFYQRQGNRSVVGNIAASAVPVNSWMISALAMASKGNFPLPQVQERWLSRVQEARQQVTVADLMDGTNKTREQLQNESVALAQHSLAIESILAFGTPTSGKVDNVKLRQLTQRQSALVKENKGDFNKANTQLAIELSQQGYNFPAAIVSQLNSSIADNRYGFYANIPTLSGIQKNMKALEHVDALYADNPFVGELFNKKTADGKYSPIADDALYGMKLNGKPLKTRDMTQQEAIKQQQIRAAWAEYFQYIDYINADAKSRGIDINSTDYNNIYGDLKKQIKSGLEDKFPYFKTAPATLTLHKSDAYIALAAYFLRNKQFMNTVGKNNDAIDGLKLYMETRKLIVKDFQDNVNATGYTSLTSKANRKYADMMASIAKYIYTKHPKFEQMYSRYLSEDELRPIDETLLKEGSK